MPLLQRIQNKLWVEMNPRFRKHIIAPRYKKWGKKIPPITILSNNCLGGVITHDLRWQFLSPTVNLWMLPKHFVRYCARLEYYSQCTLKFVSSKELPSTIFDDFKIHYPVAYLDDIIVFFQHYATQQEAEEKWKERTARIRYDRICCILCERDKCTKEDMINFDQLPYPTAILVHTPMPDIPNSHYIHGFEKKQQLGNVMDFKSGHFFGKKYYDDFNFIKFFQEI